MRTPLVAIIGLPNSGKSTLFNKVLGFHSSLTYPEAGTTRDRHYGLTSWNGLDFYLIDTAGIINRPDSELEKNIQKQTAIAEAEADLIIFVADGKTQVGSGDYVLAQRLSQSKKPLILGVNKIDVRNTKSETAVAEFQKLGLGTPLPFSSVNGSGIGDLLDEVVSILRKTFTPEENDFADRIKIAFVGKPNVGKSSLINSLLKQERLLVDEKAGTTRSTVEIPFDHQDHKFLLLDTAGIKRRWKTDIDVEAAAALQSIRTIGRTDVAFLVLDASADITVQDQTVAAKILEQNRMVVILLNKTDLLSEEEKDKLLDKLPHHLPQLWWAPVVFTSSKDGTGLDLALKFAHDVYENAGKETSQEELDYFLDQIIQKHMPGKMEDQRMPKIYNLKQVGTRPPVFKLTVNLSSAISQSWRKFFEKQFRLKFGFEGTPMVFKYVRRS